MPFDDAQERNSEDYTKAAPRWKEATAKDFFNQHWERPAMLNCIPADLSGQYVLDAGCAAGYYASHILTRNAEKVIAVDINSEMVRVCTEECRERGGGRLDARVGDLMRLDFIPDSTLHGIVASLVVHYFRDLSLLFRALYQKLRPNGFLLFSMPHPFASVRERFNPSSYFAVERVLARWTIGKDLHMEVIYFRRPLVSILDALKEAGLCLDFLKEPEPDPASSDELYTKAEKEKHSKRPAFLIVQARRPG
jgi:SAM-dependent methyltransferase